MRLTIWRTFLFELTWRIYTNLVYKVFDGFSLRALLSRSWNISTRLWWTIYVDLFLFSFAFTDTLPNTHTLANDVQRHVSILRSVTLSVLYELMNWWTVSCSAPRLAYQKLVEYYSFNHFCYEPQAVVAKGTTRRRMRLTRCAVEAICWQVDNLTCIVMDAVDKRNGTKSYFGALAGGWNCGLYLIVKRSVKLSYVYA